MEDIIIWGAGKTAMRRFAWAIFAKYRVLFFVDNDPDKWGKMINNIPVHSPKNVKEHRCMILIPDEYLDEITAQLDLISYYGRKIGFSQFKKEVVCRKDVGVDFSGVNINDKTSFIFDSYFSGMNWGGAENWSCIISNQLARIGIQTHVICGPSDKFDQFTDHCIHFFNQDELRLIEEMAQKIAEFLPCVFISVASIALYAANLVKTAFPDQIQIVLVAHNDREGIYDNFKFWADRINKIICISEKIHKKFKEEYGLEEDILVYRPNPIQIPKLTNNRKVHGGALKIGFAARLMKLQKRADLLTEVIEACMKKGLDVEFNIAGEGDCLELLRIYVFNKHLENKVHILGWIPPTKMPEFWEKQDIYLNISVFEGMSLAMLEAMACGAVPVVTDVSGVSDVIEDGKNGFVVPIDGWLEVVNKIETLTMDRERLCRASDYNMSLIRKKFDISDYAEWMRNTFHFGS